MVNERKRILTEESRSQLVAVCNMNRNIATFESANSCLNAIALLIRVICLLPECCNDDVFVKRIVRIVHDTFHLFSVHVGWGQILVT